MGGDWKRGSHRGRGPRWNPGRGGRGTGGNRSWGYGQKHDQEGSAVDHGPGNASRASSETIAMFEAFATELDSRKDKYERLVKLSRDITIESKRTIFLLHRVVDEEANDASKNSQSGGILQEATTKLKDIRETLWRHVALELVGHDPFMYSRAYSAGLQEFVEAFSFYCHLKDGCLPTWRQVQDELTFSVDPEKDVDDDGSPSTAQVLVPIGEFMMGLADLPGEIMRQAINHVGMGETDACFRLLGLLRQMQGGYLVMRRDAHRELGKKLSVLDASVRKVEAACYDVNVRGVEVPKDCLGRYLKLNEEESRRHLENPTRDFLDPDFPGGDSYYEGCD